MRYKILILTILCSLCFTASQAQSQVQWKKVFRDTSSGARINRLICYKNNVIAFSNGSFLSMDSGQTWKLTDSSASMKEVARITYNDSIVFAGSVSYGVYASRDSGKSWKATSVWKNGLIFDIKTCGNNVLVASDLQKVIISKNNGTNWDTGNKNVPFISPFAGRIDRIGVIGNASLAFYAGQLFISYDNGENWSLRNDSCPQGGAVLTFHNKIFIGNFFNGDRSIYMSEDTGLSWKRVFKLSGADYIMGFCTDGKIICAAVKGEGVLLSTDSGLTWSFINNGLGKLAIWDVTMDQKYVYCGADSGYVFRRSLFEITGIKTIPSLSSELFALKLYPNPSSNYTNFVFGRELKEGNITIYDMTGKEVRDYNCINADRYQLARGNLASGTYIYILTENGKKLATGKLQIQSI